MCALKGFTLVELLVTIGLLLTMTLIVFVTLFASSPMLSLRGAAEQVVGDVRLARDLSVSEHSRYRVLFTAGSNIYSLQKLDPLSGVWADAEGTQQARPLPEGIRVQSVDDLDGGVIIFDSLGAPYEGSGSGTSLVGSGTDSMDYVVLEITDSGKTADVIIAPGSGRVDIVL